MKQRQGRKPTETQDVTKLDDGAMVTGKTADSYFGISRATRWRREKSGRFPKARKVGGCSRYVLGELRAQAKADAQAGAQS